MITDTRVTGRTIHAAVSGPWLGMRPTKVTVVMGRRLLGLHLGPWRPVQVTVEGPGADGWGQVRYRGRETKPAWLQADVDAMVRAWWEARG